MKIAEQRCFNHRDREAAARCPECERFFCRECITEHDDRVICAGCLAQQVGRKKKDHSKLFGVVYFFQAVFGLILLWFIFYTISQVLLSLPSAFHEGELWKEVPKVSF